MPKGSVQAPPPNKALVQAPINFAAQPLYEKRISSYCILSGADVNMTDEESADRQFVFQVIGGEGNSKETTMMKIKYTRKYVVDSEYVDEVEADAAAEIYNMSKWPEWPGRRPLPSSHLASKCFVFLLD